MMGTMMIATLCGLLAMAVYCFWLLYVYRALEPRLRHWLEHQYNVEIAMTERGWIVKSGNAGWLIRVWITLLSFFVFVLLTLIPFIALTGGWFWVFNDAE
ncbi:hypothetical protein AWR27_06945 [Spirosoma montaniterrae]|uniref:Uncharacterized protein n=1 Tax=Spirosoma montaniterrae TaxID=1178516 RepID=A0A1P9WUN2_9BACT|nr:hypothetical protein AWR27_06945 [Spirosoma montaniterrae]